jgi:hypothetical protein
MNLHRSWFAPLLISGCAVLLPAQAAPTNASCPMSPPALQQGAVQARWQVVGASLQTGRHLSLDVQLCPADASLLRVDATMPAHQHGMNYRPTVRPLPDGRWRVDGLLFHMPGAWQLQFDVRAGGRIETLRDSVTLP